MKSKKRDRQEVKETKIKLKKTSYLLYLQKAILVDNHNIYCNSLQFFQILIMSSCCPPSAWGELKNGSYTAKGVVEAVGDLDVYRVGESSKCIIWNYDVLGFDGGRTRQMADFLADQGEFPIFFTWRNIWLD